MQRARGLFREYRQAFAPRGPGDVAGQRLQRIVQTDASPNEVAAQLFGSPGSGKVTGGQVQTLSRLREAVGADSDAWRATQQALVARHLGGEGRDLGSRLDYLLSGEGRPLMAFLSGQQQIGLRTLKGATRQLENARQGMPAWVSDLERTGFDPNEVARSLFGGSGVIGSRPGAALEAQAARGLLGPDSREWAGLRQAAVQRLMAAGEGAGGAAKVAQQVAGFTDGPGKGVASTLFSAQELGEIRRFGAALRTVLTPEGTVKPGSDAKLEGVKIAFDRIAHMIAFQLSGFGGLAVSVGSKAAREAALSQGKAYIARRSFEGGAPRLPVPPQDYAVAAGNTAGRLLAPLGDRAAGY